MKMLRFLLLVMIAAVALERVGFAGQSSPASQAPSQSIDKAAEPNEAHNGTDQARPGEVDQNRKRPSRQTRNTASHRSRVNRPKAAPRHRVRLDKTATNNLRAHATGRATGLQQTSSKAAAAVSGKAAGHRTPPVPSPTVSVNGQHFRNFRDPGARLAVSGGPLTATRGTGAINGTNMRRKP